MTAIRPNQRRAIEALASGATTEVAAVEAGVTIRTLYRWKTEAPFKEALQAATDAALEDATAALTFAALDAVKTLQTIANDKTEKGSTRVQASRAILYAVLRLREQVELEERLSALEARLENQQNEHRTAHRAS